MLKLVGAELLTTTPPTHACTPPQVVSEIKPEWLVEIAPHYYNRKEIMEQAAKKLPKALGRAQETATVVVE
jgi:hypothetical protein